MSTINRQILKNKIWKEIPQSLSGQTKILQIYLDHKIYYKTCRFSKKAFPRKREGFFKRNFLSFYHGYGSRIAV